MRLDTERARVSGGELAYVDEGQGPAVVLLHGFPTSSHLWRDLVPMLASRFRAIAPDLLGYGDSTKPEDPEALTIRAQARHVGNLLDELGVTEFAAVGHDIGGGVAQLLALEGGATTLILADPISFDSWPIEAVKMLQAAEPEQADQELVTGVVTLALDTGMVVPERLTDEDRTEYLRPWLADPPSLFRAARGIDGVGLTGTEDRLAALDARALVVWGEEDAYQPAVLAEQLGEALPGATVALLPGCGHYVTEDAPQAVLPLISEYLRVHHLGVSHHHAGATPVELGISFDRPPLTEPED
ncbi:MAG: alpha/beta fold hydrolase [Actinomycetota bacterium]